MTDPSAPPSQSFPMLETPKDLFELYMITRAEVSVGQSFYELYLKLLSLIDVGKEMLPPEKDDLRAEAEKILSDENYYPGTRQMALTAEGDYQVGPGDSTTGLIIINRADLGFALEEVKNQQATRLIPRLKVIDSRIFKSLIELGIIDVKKPSMEELMAQDVMLSIQQKAERQMEP